MKLTIAGMLLLAIVDLPYEYYTILRFVVCIAAAFNAYVSYESDKQTWTWIFGAIAILFNPIRPIYLDKVVWVIIDAIVAFIFLFSMRQFKSKN